MRSRRIRRQRPVSRAAEMLPQSGIAFIFAGRFKFGQPNRWANGSGSGSPRSGFPLFVFLCFVVKLVRFPGCDDRDWSQSPRRTLRARRRGRAEKLTVNLLDRWLMESRSDVGLPSLALPLFASQVWWGEAGVLSDSCKHSGTDLLSIVKSKDVIGPSWSRQDPMGSACLPLDRPSDSRQCLENLAGFRCGPLAHVKPRQ